MSEDLSKLLADTARLTNRIPQDIAFYATMCPDIQDRLQSIRKQLLKSLNALLALSAKDSDHAQQIHDLDDLDDHYQSVIVNTVDDLFEEANQLMDEVNRKSKATKAQTEAEAFLAQHLLPATTSSVVPLDTTGKTSKSDLPAAPKQHVLDRSLRYAAHIMKPQIRFEDEIDNTNTPFVPKLVLKHNAKVPYVPPKEVGRSLPDHVRDHMKSLGLSEDDASYPHPYEFEIQHLEYPRRMLESAPEILYAPLDRTPFKFIDTVPEFMDLVRLLDGQTEFAIDLEAHDFRSYQGFVCLMQISTRTQDFIVDTLALRSSIHHLNSSFSNPNIVKIMHGADGDNVWLQRDFGVYLVNLFDTYHASHILELGQHSLAFLLKHYADVVLDKKYQMADWRIRPLPDEMMRYAREDTHYLLYVYDRMRNDLLDAKLRLPTYSKEYGSVPPDTYSSEPMAAMNEFLRRCAVTTLKVYVKPIYKGDSYHMVATKSFSQHRFTFAELIIFKHLHHWRDATARKQDENVRYIMPNFLLFRIMNRVAQDNQATLSQITDSCSQFGTSAGFASAHAKDILMILEKALEEVRANQAHAEEEMRQLEAKKIENRLKEADRKADRQTARQTTAPTMGDELRQVAATVFAERKASAKVAKTLDDANVTAAKFNVAEVAVKRNSTMFGDDSSDSERGQTGGNDDDDAISVAAIIHDKLNRALSQPVKPSLPPEGPAEPPASKNEADTQMIESVEIYQPDAEQRTEIPEDTAVTDTPNFHDGPFVLSELKRKSKSAADSSKQVQKPSKTASDFLSLEQRQPKRRRKADRFAAIPADRPMTPEDLRELTATIRRSQVSPESTQKEKSFDPYSRLEMDPALSKSAPRSKVWMKSGAKSKTFKK